ncbi:MAG: hypothetical protein WDN06_16970 [Asticcacaulis sp.]
MVVADRRHGEVNWRIATGDEALLTQAYQACALLGRLAFDIPQYGGGTGLTEGFCSYDTGHDNSPRWAGIPPQCPNQDAKRFPDGFNLPRLCPDLSATTYGARMALASNGQGAGQGTTGRGWKAPRRCAGRYSTRFTFAEDAAFYDLDADGKSCACAPISSVASVASMSSTRACSTICDAADPISGRLLGALSDCRRWRSDDPAFVRPITGNSWGGPAQAQTALRASRWMEHYGRPAEFSHMMEAWCKALMADMTFRQQVDPVTGAFTQSDAPGYSPAALVMMDYTWRLAGVVEGDDELWWNVRPATRRRGSFRLPLDGGGTAAMAYDRKGVNLSLNGKAVARIEGTARLVTDKAGKPLALVGIGEKPQKVAEKWPGHTRHVTVAANQRITL